MSGRAEFLRGEEHIEKCSPPVENALIKMKLRETKLFGKFNSNEM